MAKPGQAFNEEAAELMLELLEIPSGSVSGMAVRLHRTDAALCLINAALLVPAGRAEFGTDATDDDDFPARLEWHQARNAWGTVDAAGCWHEVPAGDEVQYEVDVPAVLKLLVPFARLPPGWLPKQIIGRTVWDIGDIAVHGIKARRPTWFARQLVRDVDWRSIAAVAMARPHPLGRLVLTSTAADRLPQVPPPGLMMVSIGEVLSPGTFSVDEGVLAARLGQPISAPGQGWLGLSEDGRTLRIGTAEHIHFRAAGQIKVVRALVAASEAGKRCRAADLLDLAGSGASNLQNLFGARKWAQLSIHLRSVNGGWAFDM